MITLHDKRTGDAIGPISEDELQFLIDSLEEESTTDTDYYVNKDTIDMLEEDGAPPSLLALLRGALRGREDMDIEWKRD